MPANGGLTDVGRALAASLPPEDLGKARAIMDSAPKFDGDSKLSAEDTEALKQCIQIAYHFAGEQAAGA